MGWAAMVEAPSCSLGRADGQLLASNQKRDRLDGSIAPRARVHCHRKSALTAPTATGPLPDPNRLRYLPPLPTTSRDGACATIPRGVRLESLRLDLTGSRHEPPSLVSSRFAPRIPGDQEHATR